ncbi:hypothetical protein, partial [Flavobacterium silvaticum]|uniref:hypothetical protein n=1 Tax=Flavobacterium silvaticum TaxID=1852020 RepID=UPI001B7D1BF4
GWTVSPPGIVSLSTTSATTTTLTKVAQGTVTLFANLVNACGQTKAISKTITVGTPVASIIGPYCPTESAPCFLSDAAPNGYLQY